MNTTEKYPKITKGNTYKISFGQASSPKVFKPDPLDNLYKR